MLPHKQTLPPRVVIVDDDPDVCVLLRRWLESAGHTVEVHPDGDSCSRGLTAATPDVVCLDLNLPDGDGLDVLRRITTHHRRLPVVILTSDTNVDRAITAMKAGAHDYLTKPLDRTRLVTAVVKAAEYGRMALEIEQLKHEVDGWQYPGIVGRSAPMRELFRQMDRIAPTDVSVLLQGESGTGKELVARAIHEASGRSDGPFVAINCAAVPETLQESELFGHEKGAFTGAEQRRQGRFEQADGGTLMLDEIADLSFALQAKLLRVLQERSFYRVGGTREIRPNFRLIAATHTDLRAAVEAGNFREDLYYRLAVYELDLPPLRDRAGDIALLAETFARDFGERMSAQACTLDADTIPVLESYAWPGNVRELQNAIQRAVVASEGDAISPEALPDRVRHSAAAQRAPLQEALAPEIDARLPSGTGPPLGASESLAAVERFWIQRTLERSEGNLTHAAERLGISRTTLYRKMARYELAPERSRAD